MPRARPSHLRRGDEAEQLACDHLLGRGLSLLERNYRCPHGEIDLVMQAPGTLVFVEVRYRRAAQFGTPAETVDARKQARLRATAEHFLQRHPQGCKSACRFDIVAVSGEGADARLEWLQDAF
jgi:putative endonuclease